MLRRIPLLAAALFLALVAPAAAEETAPPVWKDYAPSATLEGHTSLVRCVAFSPDGALLVTGGSDATLRLWDPATGKARGALVLPRSG